jgi:hypothetical protein
MSTLATEGLHGRASECALLDDLNAAIRGGESRSLVLRGEAGIGKTALLEYLIASAAGFQVVRAVGVQGEVDLPYAGLHQLCRSMLDGIAALPEPQSDALRVAFGLSSGEAPDRYIVGLAALSLMSEAAATQPLLCVVDDAQWLDSATTRALAFVARRLGADSVGLVFASRETMEDLESVPELQLGGLGAADSRALLDSVVIGHLDARVRERFLEETHGNPLALIELPRALTLAEAASGIVRQSGDSLSSRIEDSFRRQLEPLPDETRRLLVAAAAEPLGDPLLLLRASARLGLSVEAADAAEEAGLFHIGERCSFRHPLVRSAVYGAATQRERRLAHGALAEATDPHLDPDRKAWHRAQATVPPDEDVAAELERTAARAKARGGLAGAAAFLERAATLTPDGGKRAERMLAAAEAMYEAGAFGAAADLLRAIEAAQLDELRRARSDALQARVALSLGGGDSAALQLIAAAERLSQLDPPSALVLYLEAGRVTFFLGKPELVQSVAGSAAKAFAESPASGSVAVGELILRGLAQGRVQRHFPAGYDLLREAAIALRDKPELDESDLQLLHQTDSLASVTRSLWDFDTWEALARRTVQLARECGSLSTLPNALRTWAEVKVAAGDFAAAEAALAEAEAID